MSVLDTVVRWCLRLLPAEFRGQFGREIESAYRAERAEAGSRFRVARLWMATIGDIFRTAPAEHADILRRDLAFTFRMLWRRPALAATATLTLALGIGANTAIFSVVDGVLLSPLPYPDPDRLAVIQEAEPGAEPGTTGYFSFDAIRSAQQSFESVAALAGWSAILAGDTQDPERVRGSRVTSEFFRTLGVTPAIGRDFDVTEDQPTRRRVVLLSDGLWRRRFGADPGIVGTSITINQVPYTVAGVMPASLNEIVSTRIFPNTEIWTLLGYSIDQPQACRTCRHIFVVGRMKRGVAVAQAEADITRIYRNLSTQYAGDYSQPTAVVTPVREQFLGPVRPVLLLLWGAVVLLLLMTCANIANLLLIRASEREEEMAIRRALGVAPARMLRQLLTEAMVLALAGGAAGALLAWWGTALLTANGPPAIPRLAEVAVDGRVLLYAFGVSAATGLLFGLAPARLLLTRRESSSTTLRRATAGPAAWRYRATLIAVNVALSVLLLVGSGLLVRSFLRLLAVDPGFTPRQLLTFQMDLSGQAYAAEASIDRFYDELTERLTRLPGVTGVSVATQLPIGGNFDRSGITIEGRELENPAEAPEADRYAVRLQYFETMRIPLRRGRLFDASDTRNSLPVAIIGETMARELWPDTDPIGRRIRVAGGPRNPMRTIVGIVGDVRHYGLHLPATLQVYIPHTQTIYPEPMTAVVVRLAADDPLAIAGAVREQVRAVDRLQAVTQLRSYDAMVAESMATRRFTLLLIAIFAGTALVLAIVGLYGALSYLVGQRRREIGVRVALGAGSRAIRRLVMRHGMRPVIVGLGTGVALSFGAGRLIASLVYGIAVTDAVTYASVLALVAGSALVACALPAHRAASIDPAETLRAD